MNIQETQAIKGAWTIQCNNKNLSRLSFRDVSDILYNNNIELVKTFLLNKFKTNMNYRKIDDKTHYIAFWRTQIIINYFNYQ